MKLFDKDTWKLAGILFAFAAVVALVLGFVNGITAPRIEARNAAALKSAMSSVLEAENYEKLDYTGSDANVVAVYKAGEEGYVVECSVSGSQGMVGMVVGVAADGETVTGIGITSHAETAGLGAVAAADTDAGVEFRDQFIGVKGHQAVVSDGGSIEALTGATVTSRAVTTGVNSAIDAVATLG